MSFDALPIRPQRVAIIGGGISGLAAAYLLSPHHAVTLYEAAPRLGGHARTVMAGRNGDQPVDTGFIVFNYANYPHLTRMFQDLDVPVAKSDMSFGASINDGKIEYGLNSLSALLAQPRNMLRPGFSRMVRDILRFNKKAEAMTDETSLTIGEFMDDLRLGDWFQRYYLMPLCGAIWSTPPAKIRSFPARALIQFFRNHALLSTHGQHQWWTVDGGSIEYIRRLEQHLRGRGAILRTNAPVQGVRRNAVESTVCTADAPDETFDQVIFACHPDQTLRLLEQPTAQEQAALSAIRFQDNQMILHRDEAQMPRRKSVWSSWVYKADTTRPEPAIGVTYWMNRLQNIPQNDPLFVSLNPSDPVPDELIYDQKTFRHPVFDTAALNAQQQLRDLQGQNNTWFAGAYTRHGFHEDGFASAARIARLMDRQFA
ncbi:NAD(P)/FAD-dependent oxidoreductase [Sulfitobacter mediterraneus]|jgi:predicted NAD/FAD-binding protein|uniref:Putative NAD/FAD-binding protein n=1 Tax=Sulfitobacter mediterraneus TaxID=83219 RepID=A0A2T6CJQ5_9RHOB|nr:FAD-dependent oxidoreductase [Sulfitobacter mediterraneus]KIN78690.1 Amine oxidoreductase-like protein [Sulfitobacter mediterraneus KCTC 32188]PTX75714.1 putative NAD/FAD-binding protein [Sulfitobacter mediterraneus]